MGELEFLLAKGDGALPDSYIKEMMRQNMIMGGAERYVGPASLDLPLTERCYRVADPTILLRGQSVEDYITSREFSVHNLASDPMEVGVTYLAKLDTRLCLPRRVYGFANPRSKSGRHDLQARTVADGVPAFNSACPGGYSGSLWVEMSPNSFPVIIPPGEAVCQMRFFNRNTILSRRGLAREFEKIPLLYSPDGEAIAVESLPLGIGEGDSLMLTLMLDGEFAGWECRGTQKVLDYRKGKGAYRSRVSDFFTKIPRADQVELKEESFYIFTTRERVMVPPWLACEMVPMHDQYGEFRAHYAGYIDPGWGYGFAGEALGRQITLEVRTLGRPVYLRNGQLVARIRYEKLADVPKVFYDGSEKPSDFTKQHGPQLSSYFT